MLEFLLSFFALMASIVIGFLDLFFIKILGRTKVSGWYKFCVLFIFNNSISGTF